MSALKENGATRAYVKRLAPNDNSKNQIYLGGSFAAANVIPMGAVSVEPSGRDGRHIFKARVDLWWLDSEGTLTPAPSAQLILYPQYPEVRLSGLLKQAPGAPREVVDDRSEGRYLVLAVTQDGRVVAHCSPPEHALNSALEAALVRTDGVLDELPLVAAPGTSSLDQLLSELKRIHRVGWVDSKRLDKFGRILDCQSPNCGGYTLEAELGVRPNGIAQPDFLGWEIKQHSVNSFDRPSGTITLMTPEPDGGVYATDGVSAFVRRFGYPDKRGRVDRLNFGGLHRVGETTKATGLTLRLAGFDAAVGKVESASGSLQLVSSVGEVAASWSFRKLLELWRRKHAHAAYLMSQRRSEPRLQYRFGSPVSLGVGTNFMRLLRSFHRGSVYFDPGIKLTAASTGSPTSKRRNQFRVRFEDLGELYDSFTERPLA